MAKITLAEYENECKSFCPLYIVLLSTIFTVNIGIATYLIYYKFLYFKQHFIKNIKMVKDMNIKHRSYNFFSDMMPPKILMKKIGYITFKQFDEYNKINSVNSFRNIIF